MRVKTVTVKTKACLGVLILGAMVCAALAGHLSDRPGQTVKMLAPISAPQCRGMYGGCFISSETGCETEADNCADHDVAPCAVVNPMGPEDPAEPGHWLNQGSACTTCQHNGQRERCADWGHCITWPTNTCSDCVTDPAFDCGMESLGTCNLGECVIQSQDYQNCGDNYQCHTVHR